MDECFLSSLPYFLNTIVLYIPFNSWVPKYYSDLLDLRETASSSRNGGHVGQEGGVVGFYRDKSHCVDHKS